MKRRSRAFKAVACLCVVSILGLTSPFGAARAAMVGTESVIGAAEVADAERARLRALLLRDEARAQFERYGVDRAEALARIDSLSDREVAEIAGKLDALPAGGSSSGSSAGLEAAITLMFIGLVAVVALIVLVIGAMIKAVSEDSEDSAESAGDS